MTLEAITNAFKIFWPDLAGQRGKTVRTWPEKAEMEYMVILHDLIEFHEYVTMTGDIMFLNRVPLFVIVCQGPNLVSAEFLESRTAAQIAKRLQYIAQIYSRAGFIVWTFLLDGEFKAIKDKIPDIMVNTMAANKHVCDIKCKICVIKEHV